MINVCLCLSILHISLSIVPSATTANFWQATSVACCPCRHPCAMYHDICDSLSPAHLRGFPWGATPGPHGQAATPGRTLRSMTVVSRAQRNLVCAPRRRIRAGQDEGGGSQGDIAPFRRFHYDKQLGLILVTDDILRAVPARTGTVNRNVHGAPQGSWDLLRNNTTCRTSGPKGA